MYVCVCVCVRVRVFVRACVCVRVFMRPQNIPQLSRSLCTEVSLEDTFHFPEMTLINSHYQYIRLCMYLRVHVHVCVGADTCSSL